MDICSYIHVHVVDICSYVHVHVVGMCRYTCTSSGKQFDLVRVSCGSSINYGLLTDLSGTGRRALNSEQNRLDCWDHLLYIDVKVQSSFLPNTGLV